MNLDMTEKEQGRLHKNVYLPFLMVTILFHFGVQTKKVTIVPFHEVSVEHAYKEGESNKTLDFWREAHEKFFTGCLNQVGLKFTTDMKVVCEEFSVVYK